MMVMVNVKLSEYTKKPSEVQLVVIQELLALCLVLSYLSVLFKISEVSSSMEVGCSRLLVSYSVLSYVSIRVMFCVGGFTFRLT